MKASFGFICCTSLLLIALLGLSSEANAASRVSCASLAAVRLPNTTLSSATEVPGPTFTPKGGVPINNLPAFCRVVGAIKPTSASNIQFEVWLPLANWNGKFNGVGNGGYAGAISYDAMAIALQRGYATVSTDTGHVGDNALWAFNQPELIADWGWRSVHLTTENGKAITRAFYGKRPNYSYFTGCSKGGGQGLMEAQRFPADYDGIVAGDSANNITRLFFGILWSGQALHRDPESYIPSTKLPAIEAAANARCDANDGVVDGVIDHAFSCRFEPASMQCPAGQDSPSCLTPKQVAALEKIYAGARSSAGIRIFPGWAPGGETGPNGWTRWMIGTMPGNSRDVFHFGIPFFQNFVFSDRSYDPIQHLNFDSDFAFTDARLAFDLNSTDPDLRAFRHRGGKLITYAGWADASIPAQDSIDYFERVVGFLGGHADRDDALERTQEFFRLFLAPGRQHCGAGPGPNSFDALAAIEDWVERGKAPKRIVASHSTDGVVDRTRPLCPYPKAAVYRGEGSTNEAENFVCREPRGHNRKR